jgi:hypothetical protein
MRRTYIITNSLRYSIVHMLRFPSFFFSFLFGCCGRMESSHSAAGLCLVLYLTLFVTCFCFADSPPDLMAECRLTHAQKQKKKSTIPPAGAQQWGSSAQSERLTDRDLHRAAEYGNQQWADVLAELHRRRGRNVRCRFISLWAQLDFYFSVLFFIPTFDFSLFDVAASPWYQFPVDDHLSLIVCFPSIFFFFPFHSSTYITAIIIIITQRALYSIQDWGRLTYCPPRLRAGNYEW